MESPAYHAAPMPPPAVSADGPDDGVGARSRRLTRVAAGFYAVTTLFAVGYALFSGTLGSLFGTAPPSLGHLLAAVGMGGLLVVATRVAPRAFPRVERAWGALARLLGPLDLRAALTLALCSGVAEELLFRGALWPHLGLVGTSLLFGLVHTLPRRDLAIYPLFATVAGFLFGLLRQGSGSVLPAMVAHVTVNAVNLVWLARGGPLGAGGSGAAPAPVPPAPDPRT